MQRHPVVDRYLAQLEHAIRRLDPQDRREVLQEIHNHIAEATAAGKQLDVVLEALGPADALGRAYAVELGLHPQGQPRQNFGPRWFAIIGLVIVLSLPTLIVVSTLGSIGLSFVASGMAAFVIGVVELAGVLPLLHLSDLPPGVPVVAGPALFVVGILSLAALRAYVLFVTRTVRAALPCSRSGDWTGQSA